MSPAADLLLGVRGDAGGAPWRGCPQHELRTSPGSVAHDSAPAPRDIVAPPTVPGVERVAARFRRGGRCRRRRRGGRRRRRRQAVGPFATAEAVVARVAENHVVSVGALDGVVARAGADDVVTGVGKPVPCRVLLEQEGHEALAISVWDASVGRPSPTDD